MNDSVQAINICIDFFCLAFLVFILIQFWFGFWRNDKLQHSFTGMILAYTGVIITYAIIHINDGELSAPVYLAVDLVSFVSSASCMFLFSQYVFSYLEKRKIETHKVTRYIVLDLCVIDFFLNLGVDLYSGDITREWTSNETIVSWLATALWGFVMIGNIIYFRKQLGRRTFILFILYFILPFIAGSASPFVEDIRIDIITLTFVFGMLFIGVQITENASRMMFERLSFHDSMTGLYNRNYLILNADDIKRTLPCSYVVFDLNNLKTINDNYGHSKGDEYISHFAELLKKITPPEAEAIRTGGDEFLVILPNHDSAQCEAYLKSYIEESQAQGVPESAAYGYAVRTTGMLSEDETIALADEQMYTNKRASKKARQ